MPDSDNREPFRSSLQDAPAFWPGMVRVLITQLAPDDSDQLESKAELMAKQTNRRKETVRLADGGEVFVERCRWRIESQNTEFELRPRDEIQGADEVRWRVDDVKIGCLVTRFICECTRVSGQ